MNRFINIDKKVVKNNIYNLKNIVFEVTDSCNLSCKYCGYAELYKGYDKRDHKQLSFAKAKQIMDYLFRLWREVYSPGVNYPVIIGFYGGEPLMNISFIKELVDYLEKVQEIGKSFKFNMTTNAILLDKYMDYLVRKNFILCISLDGDEDAHSYRVNHSGKNSFNQVFRNVKMLQEKYPEYFSKQVMFTSVLHNRNNVYSTYRFIKNHFGKIPSITPLNNSRIKEDKVNEFRAMYQNPLQSIYSSSNCDVIENEMFIKTPRVSNLATYIHRQSGNVFNNYNDLLLEFSNSDFPPTGTCPPFLKKMFITVNGKILPCERIDHDFFMGNVYDDHVDIDYEKVAEKHNSYVFKLIQQCHHCAINRQCSQCVYQNDNIRKKNVKCIDFCVQTEFDKRNVRNIDFLREHPHYYKRILEDVFII
jgi:uncharacterized protein